MKGRIHWYNDPNSDKPRVIATDDLQRWVNKLSRTDEHFIVYPMGSPIPKRK